MGKMKELYTVLEEAERLLCEYDPVAFEAGRRLVENAQTIALSNAKARNRTILSSENQLPTPF